MAAAIRIESTAHCGAVPALLFAAVELGLEIALHVRDDGAFVGEDGTPGPAMVTGGTRIVGVRACLERLFAEHAPHLVEASAPLLQRHFDELGPSLRDWIRARSEPARAAELRHRVEHHLDRLHHELGERPWLLDAPSAVDGLAMLLPRLPALGLELSVRWPRLADLAARLVGRTAYAKTMELRARLAAVDVATPAQVLEWWFGAPAHTPAELEAKLERWFLRGAQLDDEVRERFGPTLDRALNGSLDAWAADPRGYLALVLVLDQLPRHAFRDTPRAYAGDARAQALCVQGIERGFDRELSPVEQAFFTMPLVHAEDPALQERAVALHERAHLEATPASRAFAEIGLEQARKHHEIVRRFGRFPHRNAILGRDSTPEEREWLEGWMARAVPQRYRDRFAPQATPPHG